MKPPKIKIQLNSLYGTIGKDAPHIKKAIQYIENAGHYNIISKTHYTYITHFDEDHEPIGPILRYELKNLQLVEEDDNMFIRLL